MLGPLGGITAPTKFGPAHQVTDAGGTVPGGAKVPFHVRVKGEEVSGAVEGQIETISQATADQFPIAAIGTEANDPTTDGVMGAVEAGWHQVVDALCCDGSAPLDHVRKLGAVAADQVEGVVVRPDDDVVGTVFARRIQFQQQARLVKLIVTVRVAETVHACLCGLIPLGHGDIEAVEGVKQAMRPTHLGGDAL